jgi:Cu/Ag efflux protein CusF
MRLWRVIVLMALTLAVGIGLGYVRWGREVRELREALARAQEVRPQLAAAPGPWTARGVVRIVLPNQGVLFLTHEAIPGLMPGATRAFPVSGPALFVGLAPGDGVRFTLERRGQRVVLVAIEKDKGA